MRVDWKYLAFASSVLIILVAVVAIARSGSDEGGTSKPSDSGRQSDGTLPSGGEAPGPSEPSFVPSGSSNIYVIDVASRSLDQLTNNERGQLADHPAWSAGGKIVFSEASSGERLAKLFLTNADGSKRRKVPTRATNHLFQPTWSPDGRKIAMVKLGSGIHVFDLAARSLRPLEANRAGDEAPVWSPDGRTIVFQRQVTASNIELYRMDATGSGLRRLTRDPRQQVNPVWSPDGSRLAFAEQQTHGRWVVFSTNVDGSDRERLTPHRLSSQEPAWSPDGEQIAFVLQEAERASIAVIDVGGGRPKRITPRALVAAANPVWSPDGKKIVFAAHHAMRPPPSR